MLSRWCDLGQCMWIWPMCCPDTVSFIYISAIYILVIYNLAIYIIVIYISAIYITVIYISANYITVLYIFTTYITVIYISAIYIYCCLHSCYKLFSKAVIWGFDLVLSLWCDLGQCLRIWPICCPDTVQFPYISAIYTLAIYIFAIYIAVIYLSVIYIL